MNNNQPELVLFSARGRDSLPDVLAERLEAAARVRYCPTLTPLADDELVAHCRHAQVVGLTRRACTDFHVGLLRQLPALRGLAVYATGEEWLDTGALREQRVDWRILPEYSAQTVAEHALALLLTLARRVHLSDRVVRGELPGHISLRGWEVAGKRVGIVGLGRIGRRIARLVAAFDAEVVYADPAVAADGEFRAIGEAELWASCDVVILAASVQRGAPPLVDAARLATMQPGSYLINPSRPQLVDKDAMLAAIAGRRLAGYAVDEKVFTAAELAPLEPGRILQSGHTGWYSDEAMARGAEAWVDQLVDLAESIAAVGNEASPHSVAVA
jgi:phosphoglycerate dehydrogenase-like enzyme